MVSELVEPPENHRIDSTTLPSALVGVDSGPADSQGSFLPDQAAPSPSHGRVKHQKKLVRAAYHSRSSLESLRVKALEWNLATVGQNSSEHLSLEGEETPFEFHPERFRGYSEG